MDNPELAQMLRSFLASAGHLPLPNAAPASIEQRFGNNDSPTTPSTHNVLPVASAQPAFTGSNLHNPFIPHPFIPQQPQITPYHPVQSQIPPYQPAALQAAGTVETGANQSAVSSVSTPSSQPIQVIRNPANPPFQGIPSLGSGVMRQVNQQRLSSAAATIPRQPALQAQNARRSRRPGTTNGTPPGLPKPPTMEDAAVKSEDGLNTVGIRIRVKVYPPTEARNVEPILFTNYVESFNAMLDSYSLLYEYEVEPSLTLANLSAHIVDDMSASPRKYGFSSRYPRGIVQHEALPIEILALCNRGRTRPQTGHVHLQRMPAASTRTMVELFTDKNFYANPRFCLENSCFVLHFIVVHYPFSGQISVGDHTRRHKCISKCIYRQFPHNGFEIPFNSDDLDPHMSSGGETSGSDGEDTAEEDQVSLAIPPSGSQRRRPQLLRRQAAVQNFNPPVAQTRRSAGAGASQTLSLTHSPNSNSDPATSESPSALIPGQFLPQSIWGSRWIAPPIADHIDGLLSVEDVTRHVFCTVSPTLSLLLRGKSVQELAAHFHSELTLAASQKDFSKILSDEREMIIEDPDGSVRSLGAGIEAEVLYLTYQQLQSNPGRWFNPRIDDTSSIAVMHSFTTSSARHGDMYAFGALTALMLVHGAPPLPLSPMFLQWIIYGCDLHALHSDLIAEWHPELHSTIKRWIALGPTGPLESFQSHFSTWHETQIGLYRNHTEASHKSLAAEMLYRAVIGTVPPYHPEVQEFIAGFRLPCQTCPRFDFVNVLKSFAGGAELYLSLLWTSRIKGFDDLEPFLHFRASHLLNVQAFSRFGNGDTTFKSVLSSFLNSTGIPCPGLFEDAKSHFSDVINLDQIDSPAFQSKMFCWAATGRPTFAPESSNITVYLASDNDNGYCAPVLQETMLREGKISFRTCARQVRIPASHFTTLSLQTYDGSSEPKSLEDAVHHWILCEILNAIGNHSIL